jgi:ribosomal protein L11 methyltransferase
VSWQVLRLTLAAEDCEEAIGLLQALGTLGDEERPAGGRPWPFQQPWDTREPRIAPPDRIELLAYFDLDDLAPTRAARLRTAFPDLPPGACTEGCLAPGDWEERWRTSFQPFEVGRGVWLAPPWQPLPGALLIEPGMAFGTGQHPTTLCCLEAIARHARPGRTLLDVGCGTGVLALLGARLGMTAEGIDNDPEAVRAARGNARRNDLGCRLDDRPLRALSGRYDLVVANIFAEALLRLSADLVRLTGERLVLAGILADREDRVAGAFAPLAPVGRRLTGDWVALELVRP